MKKTFFYALTSSLVPLTLALANAENLMDACLEKTSLSAITPGPVPYTVFIAKSEDPAEEPVEVGCEKGPHAHRISARHQEGTGVGFSQGYSSVDAFLTLFPSRSWRPFVDLRAHYFNDDKWAANAGVGLRTTIERIKAVFGANVYYDFRDSPHSGGFHQIGPGVELLFGKWDLRANGYITIGNKTRVYQKKFTHFAGHNALFLEKKKQAMHGADIQVGAELFRHRAFNMHAAVGGYCFIGRSGKDAAGGMIRITARLSPYITIEGQGSYDAVFKGRGWGSIALNLPFGGRIKEKANAFSSGTCRRLEDRFVEQVPRFEILVVNTHRKKSIGLNPATGLPINFIFVDNVRGSSDGTFEHPYATLAQAQNNSIAGDYIYVFPGDGTTRGMNQGITLKSNQVFTSSAIPLQAETGFGMVTIPAQTTAMPKITNSNVLGSVVAVDNTTGVTVQGFELAFAGATSGVKGANINNILIANSVFPDSFTRGIDLTFGHNTRILSNQFTFSPFSALSPRGANLTNCNGSIDFKNNISTGTAIGLRLTNNFTSVIHASVTDNLVIGGNDVFAGTFTSALGTIEVSSNIAQNPRVTTAINLDLVFDGASNIATRIFNNNFSSSDTSVLNGIAGIQLGYLDTAKGSVILDGNTITNMGFRGVFINTTLSSSPTITVSNNTATNVNFNQNTLGGISTVLNGSSTLKLCNNFSTTGVAMPTPGYYINPALGAHLQSPDGTLAGVAAINSGSPGATVGPITVTIPANLVIDTVSPFNCQALP